MPADASDIATAIDLAADGDEFLLADGTFVGSVNRVFLRRRNLTSRSESGTSDACIIGDNDASFGGNIIDIREDPQGVAPVGVPSMFDSPEV